MVDPLRKRMYRIWLGPLPAWVPQFMATVERLREFGWEFVIKNDRDEIASRLRMLGVEMGETGHRKAGDYDPLIGHLFADELGESDWWGHFGLDVVFGRVEQFLPDAFLQHLEIFGNDPNAICGPFSLYRNSTDVNALYQTVPDWKRLLEEPEIQAFDELHLTRAVHQARALGQIEFASAFFQGHDKQPWHLPAPCLTRYRSGELYDHPKPGIAREIMMFHFNRKDVPKQWPLGS